MRTFALKSERTSKCLLRSVASIASIARKRNRLNSDELSSHKKLYLGSDMRRAKAEAAWWFSRTERSLYNRACKTMETIRNSSWERWGESTAVGAGFVPQETP